MFVKDTSDETLFNILNASSEMDQNVLPCNGQITTIFNTLLSC